MRIFSVTVGEYYQQLWDNDYYLTPTGRVYPPAAAVVHGLTTIITKRLPNQRDYSRRPPWSKPGRLTEPKTGVRTTALFCLAFPWIDRLYPPAEATPIHCFLICSK
jgi:hypothetical protein